MGADTVSKGMGFWGDNRKREATERDVKLQLCFLVPTLDTHILGGVENLKMFVFSINKAGLIIFVYTLQMCSYELALL